MGEAALDKFFVAFDNNTNAVYHPGEILSGAVVLDNKKMILTKGVRLVVQGEGIVGWTDGSGRRYWARETYFRDELPVMVPKDGKHEEELTVGSRTFPFQYQLPPKLPSSFHGLAGNVLYTVEAVIRRRWANNSTKRPFTVVSILDINTLFDAMEKVKGNNQKVLRRLCCSSGLVSASFHLPRKGYVPGEDISLFADIENSTDREMKGSSVELIQRVHYHSARKTKTVTRSIATVTRGAIRPRASDEWHGDHLKIPPVPPSFLPGCGIIDIEYTLQLSVDPAGLEIPLQIIIGSTPRQNMSQQQEQGSPSQPSHEPDTWAVKTGSSVASLQPFSQETSER